MNIVVLNAGSGSQRCSLFRLSDINQAVAHPRDPDWEATIDTSAPGQPAGQLRVMIHRDGKDTEACLLSADLSTTDRTRRLLELLWTGGHAPLSSPEEIDAVGHRVVHGGDEFSDAVHITAGVEAAIEKLAAFAPLHNPVNLIGIRVARETCGKHTKHVAIFDTAFHRTIPKAATTYAGPHEWLDQGIRRYGFHGTNFRWVAARAAHLLGKTGDAELRLILCHLGGGCSLCAIHGDRSIDTTMGFTPLDGIAMCTRSGAVDPGILIYLQRQGKTADEIETLLNKQSGIKGLSGLSGDTREVLPAAKAGDARAQLAMDVFIYRLRAGIGQMLAALGQPPHAIVFTDAIAEDEPEVRAAACAPFEFIGMKIDAARNRDALTETDLSTSTSAVKILLIHSREAWQIACETFELCEGHNR